MTDFNPDLAVDLGKFKNDAVDLSKEASAARDSRRRLEAAADWSRSMHKAFKGITGRPSRRELALTAIEKFNLTPDDMARAAA